jgi:hypothetical protein
MGSMLELDKKVDDLTHNLLVQSHFNQLLFAVILDGINQMSADKNSYEIFRQIVEEMKPTLSQHSTAMDEAVNEVLQMLRDPQ